MISIEIAVIWVITLIFVYISAYKKGKVVGNEEGWNECSKIWLDWGDKK